MHCFGFHWLLLFSSCLEWRYSYPLLEEAGLETWAVDILGWGFSDLGWFETQKGICLFSFSSMFFLLIVSELFELFCKFFSCMCQKDFPLAMWPLSVTIFFRYILFLLSPLVIGIMFLSSEDNSGPVIVERRYPWCY